MGGQETGHGNGERLRLRTECRSTREGRGKGGGQVTGHGKGERLRLRAECRSMGEGRGKAGGQVTGHGKGEAVCKSVAETDMPGGRNGKKMGGEMGGGY